MRARSARTRVRSVPTCALTSFSFHSWTLLTGALEHYVCRQAHCRFGDAFRGATGRGAPHTPAPASIFVAGFLAKWPFAGSYGCERVCARQFDAASSTLSKILGNIVGSPDEPKFRKLRVSNAKISALLATKGVRAILLGCGFVEEGEFLTLPDGADVGAASEAIDRLSAQADARAGAESTAKAAEIERRKQDAEKENEERKRMKMQIEDDGATSDPA